MTPEQIAAAAPPPPPCFRSSIVWVDYLTHCQTSGKTATARPFEREQFRGQFRFCGDCLPKYRESMEAAGRCRPDHFKEPACN